MFRFASTVCEEFIDVIATKVLDIIISEIKQAKYHSKSVDSTPDITNVDHLTIIFRCVLPDGPCKICQVYTQPWIHWSPIG